MNRDCSRVKLEMLSFSLIEMHSHHSHSGQFCRHAKDDLESIVLRAIELGFQTFGLSEHAPRYRLEDLFPEEVSFQPSGLRNKLTYQTDLSPSELELIYLDFLDTASKLQKKYKYEIQLLIGIETDFVTRIDLDRTKAILDSRKDIQYVVGSVHHVAGVSIDFDKSTYLRSIEHCTANIVGSTMSTSSSTLHMPQPSNPKLVPSDDQLVPFLSKYLDAQYEMIEALEPEVIGHFDLCLLFNPGYRLDGHEDVWKRVKRNVERVVRYGGLFEANGAAIRKGWETTYPSKEVLQVSRHIPRLNFQLMYQLILDMGGRICLSDDSHGIAQVGLNYGRMKSYLEEMDVKEIWHLVPNKERRDGDEVVGNRGRVIARRMADWTGHGFWAKLQDRI